MEGLPLKTRQRYLLALTFVFIIVVPILAFYATGYRLSSDFKLIKTGGIYVEVPFSGASFYVDDEYKGVGSLFQKSFFIQDLLPDVYSVRIDREDYQDWRKDFEVIPTRIANGKVLLLPKEPQLVLVSSSSPEFVLEDSSIDKREVSTAEYRELIAHFDATSTVLSSVSDVGTSTILYQGATTTVIELGDIGLWKDTEGLHAWWLGNEERFPYFFCETSICKREILVAGNGIDISNFDFFPGDNQFVIIGWPDGVFVTELDTRHPQNIQSLYPIAGVTFRVINNSVYVLDGGDLFEIEI